MKRRTFLSSSTATAAMGLLPASSILTKSTLANAPALKRNGLGLQLWTVRNQLAEDAAATIQAVAKAGYKQVELMNVMESSDIVKMAADNGMNVRSAFMNWESIANPDNVAAPAVDEIIAKAKEMGLEYLVFGYIGRPFRDTADKMKAIAENANLAAEKVSKAGMQLSYHNHSFEFEPLSGGITGFEILMKRFDEKLVNFELDVFWAAIGGWDPLDTMRSLGKRLGQIHLKDLKKGTPTIYDEGKVPNEAFQEVGDGIIKMEEVIKVAAEYGVQQFHVEQDQSPDPLASIKQSFDYTRKIW